MAAYTTGSFGHSKHPSSDSSQLQRGPLYSRPSIKALQSHGIINDIGPHWYNLGIALLDEKDFSQLQIISSNHNNETRCCTELFIYWLERHPEATWHNVVENLKSDGVGLNTVAAKVERIFPAEEPKNDTAAAIFEPPSYETEPVSTSGNDVEKFEVVNPTQNPKDELVQETRKKLLTDEHSEIAVQSMMPTNHMKQQQQHVTTTTTQHVTTCAADSTSETDRLKNNMPSHADSKTGSHAPTNVDATDDSTHVEERICEAVSEFYNGQFKEKWKNRTDSGVIKVLSALLMERRHEMNVVVLAAGTNKKKECSYFLNKGDPDEYTWGLCDGHAPSVCYRLASLYLLTEIHKQYIYDHQNPKKKSKSKSILEINCGYALRPHIKFHFFTTQLPCGFMAKNKHHLLSWKIPFKEKPHCLHCSSTILIGAYLGIQGPLSHLFNEPIYVSSITIPKSKYVTVQDSVDVNQSLKNFQAKFTDQMTDCGYRLVIPPVKLADVDAVELFPEFYEPYDDTKIDRPLEETEERHTEKELKKTAGAVSANRNIGSHITVFQLKEGIGDDEFRKNIDLELQLKCGTKNICPEDFVLQVKQKNFIKLQEAQKKLTKVLIGESSEKPSEKPLGKLKSFITKRMEEKFYITDHQNVDKVIVQLREMEDCRKKMGMLTGQVNKLKGSYCTIIKKQSPSVQQEITFSAFLSENIKQFETDCELMMKDLDSLHKSMEGFENGTKSIVDALTDYRDYRETLDGLNKFLKEIDTSSCESLFDLELMGCDWARYMQSMHNDIKSA